MSDGYQKLWGFFGLSYAAWICLPRVLMHEMPDAWQDKMAALLEEFWDQYPSLFTESEPTVSLRRNGKFSTIPDWMGNYRYPNKKEIERLKLNDPA